MKHAWVATALVWAIAGAALPALAAEAWPAPELQVFRFGEDRVAFQREPHFQAWVSESCAKATSACQAFSALKGPPSSWSSRQTIQQPGGASPGAILCKTLRDGVVRIGLDSADNEQSFCEFPDGSLVSTGSLFRRFLGLAKP